MFGVDVYAHMCTKPIEQCNTITIGYHHVLIIDITGINDQMQYNQLLLCVMAYMK